MKRRKKDEDPLNAFLNSTLNQEGYTPFYCPDHGKQLVKLPNITIEVNGVVQDWPLPLCKECSREMSSEDTFEEHHDRRKRRIRRISLMWNNLEGDE